MILLAKKDISRATAPHPTDPRLATLLRSLAPDLLGSDETELPLIDNDDDEVVDARRLVNQVCDTAALGTDTPVPEQASFDTQAVLALVKAALETGFPASSVTQAQVSNTSSISVAVNH